MAAMLLCASVAWPRSAAASLGGRPESVEADRVQMQGALTQIVRGDAYTRHELRAPSGTTVREYVSESGIVFAVTWQGPWLPDLRQVLGSYFDPYQRALRSRQRRARGVVRIEAGNLIVQSTGHQRSFSGRAFVQNLAPSGVRIESLP
jgi:hypothetical protein